MCNESDGASRDSLSEVVHIGKCGCSIYGLKIVAGMFDGSSVLTRV